MPLKVKLLNTKATPPTIAHPGEDLGYDVYALIADGQPRNEDGTPMAYNEPKAGMPYRINTLTGKQIQPIRLESGKITAVPTGLSVHFVDPGTEGGVSSSRKYGLLVRDRSSLAKKGIFVSAGVIDSGYRGELVIMFNVGVGSYQDLWPGDKIAQIIPIEVAADTVEVVQDLEESVRQEAGFGSSGQ